MLEESVQVMEKKNQPRQSAAVAKPSSNFERKNDSSNTAKYGRYNKRRENGSGRGTPSDFSNRKPLPQKSRTTLDKRPRQRGGYAGRQREEVGETEEVERQFSNQGLSKKANLNHLLSFSYASPSSEKGVGSSRRKGTAYSRKFTKERYLQANCQFVVKDCGDYTVQASDPDALVDWDLVEQVRTFSHEETTCPICLQPPAAGKITRCGHIYCWACILHYLSLGDNRCPICTRYTISKSDLRSVKVIERKVYKVGDVITLQLMKRARDSTYAVPYQCWEDREGRPQHVKDPQNTEYAKILVASTAEIQTSVIEEEYQGLRNHMASAEDSEVCFIEEALVALSEREDNLQSKIQAKNENARRLEELGVEEGGREGVGSKEKSNGRRNSGQGSKPTTPSHTVTAAATAANSSMPRNLSFDGSKIMKQYQDAFEELEVEEEEEEESVGWEEGSDADDQESTDYSFTSLNSPSTPTSPQPCPLDPLSPEAAAAAAEPPPSDAPDIGPEFVLPEMEAIDAMTTEEAIEQLTMPAELETSVGVNGSAKKSGTRNQSKSFFYFYQASDGQQIYMHSLNARCVCRECGSLELGPHTITAKIVDKEITFMTEELRRRVRYLAHVPAACEFQVVELQLRPPIVSDKTLSHFAVELKKRAQYRQRVKREDRRLAKQLNIQEKMSYGIYPEVRLALDNPDHFPAPMTTSSLASATEGSDRKHHTSISDTACPSSPELNVNAAEFVPGQQADCSTSSSPSTFSFAAALKKAKQPAPTAVAGASALANTASAAAAWPAMTGASSAARRADSEESDNEDRVPVPAFQNSFSDAISRKLQTLRAEGGEGDKSKEGKKKKKKEKIMLFSTDMMRR